MRARLADQRLRQFLTSLASTQPTPGGGSAAAAAAALGAALYVKVSRIVLARSRPAAQRRQVTRIAHACQRHQGALMRLIDLDARAYGRLLKVSRRGNGQGLRQAQQGALQAPMKICERAQAVLQETAALRHAGGKMLASDVEAGAALLVAGFVGASAMVAVNLEGLGQGREATVIRRKTLALLGAASG